MKVFLIGMPGSGKSTLSKSVGQGLGLPSIDLDEEIEKESGKSISEIFTEDGEELFRKKEHEALLKVISHYQSFVLATGGGTPCFHENMSIMNETGTTVYLEVSLHTLKQRVSNTTHRPLLKGNHESRMEQLFNEREPLYLKCKYILRESDSTDDLVYLLKSEYKS